MKINIATDAVSVLIAYCLVYGAFGLPAMGIAGSALGAAISRFVSFILAFGGTLWGWYRIPIKFADIFKFRPDIIKRILKIGLPTLMDYMFFSSSAIALTRIVAALGTVPLAINGILSQAESLVTVFGACFVTAAYISTGQSLGGNDPEKARIIAKEAVKMSSGILGAIAILVFFIPDLIIRLLTNDILIIEPASQILKVFCLIFPVIGFFWVLKGVLIGSGDTRTTMKYTVIAMWLIQIPAAYLLGIVLNFGITGVYAAICIKAGVLALLYYRRFRSNKWMEIRV
jgi:putative MATE family efflux protein